MKLRIISALVLITVVLFSSLAGGMWFIILVLLASLPLVREWDMLTANRDGMWKLVGLAYVAVPCATLIWLRDMTLVDAPNAGMCLVLALMFIVWATDIGAYFAGRRIGGPKLAPAISPSKTWAGLGGGMAAAGFVSILCVSFSPYPGGVVSAFFVGMLLAVVAQAGDLFESWLKRAAGVKDSGLLIPGHGGLLDRVDGMITATPVFGLMVGLSGIF